MIAPPEWLSSLFAWIIRASWQASVLISLVVPAQYLLRKVVPAQWRYALWFLVLLRLVLPFSLESSVSVFNYAPPASIESADAVKTTVIRAMKQPAHSLRSDAPPSNLWRCEPEKAAGTQTPVVAQAGPSGPSVSPSISFSSLARVLPLVWLLGVAVLFLRMLWANGRLASRLRRRLPLTDLGVLRLARRCAQEVGLRQTPWIMKAPEMQSPALFGFSVPRLLLPANLVEGFTAQELRHIFLHEFYHVRRRDIALNWIMAVVQILHWFNPLVWFASARMRSDRELACDAQVLSRLENSQAGDYGRTIIRLLETFSRPARAPGVVGILEDRGQMKRRILMISRFGGDSFRWRWAGLTCAALLAVAAMTDARTENIPTQADESTSPNTLALFTVLDGETGAPIAGATLNGKQTTDSHGKGGIRTAFPGYVLVRASGYIPRQIMIGGEESFERTLRMERGMTIGGVVRDEDGQAIGNAEVQILDTGMMSVGAGNLVEVTDAEGRWRCTEAPRSLDGLQLHLFHPEFAVTRYVAGVPASGGFRNTVSATSLAAGQGDIVMKRGFTITGVVTDLRGAPIEGAVVTMGFTGFPEENRGVANTDREGHFVFRNASASTTQVEVRAKGFVLQRKGINLSPGMQEIRFLMARGEILRVRVIDEAGHPVSGAILTSHVEGLSEKTDGGGRLTWISAPVRPFMLGVRATGFPEANEAVEAGERENVITLHSFREIRVSGRVVDAVTRQPLPEFQVLVSTSRVATLEVWKDYRPITEGKDGSFNFPLRDSFRPTGTVIQGSSEGDKIVRYVVGLKIKAEGYFPDTSQTVAIENGDASVAVALEPGKGVSGIVRLPGGGAVPGAKAYLCGRFSAVMESPERVRQLIGGSETLTDQAGRFQFDPEPDVRAIIVVHEKGFALIPVDQFSAPLEVTLAPWGRIDGNLRIGSRSGSGESLVLGSLPSESSRRLFALAFRTQTDAEGRFAFSRVPPGTHSIHLIKPGFGNRLLDNIEVNAGESLPVNLGGNGRPITGRIVFAPSGNPTPSTGIRAFLQTVTQRLEDMRSYPAEVDADGYFRIEDVPAGNYILRYYNPAGSADTMTVKVSVPEMPGGRSDKPLDLGTITAK